RHVPPGAPTAPPDGSPGATASGSVPPNGSGSDPDVWGPSERWCWPAGCVTGTGSSPDVSPGQCAYATARSGPWPIARPSWRARSTTSSSSGWCLVLGHAGSTPGWTHARTVAASSYGPTAHADGRQTTRACKSRPPETAETCTIGDQQLTSSGFWFSTWA